MHEIQFKRNAVFGQRNKICNHHNDIKEHAVDGDCKIFNFAITTNTNFLGGVHVNIFSVTFLIFFSREIVPMDLTQIKVQKRQNRRDSQIIMYPRMYIRQTPNCLCLIE